MKPADYKGIQNIVMKSGEQVLRLKGLDLSGYAQDLPYITVKSGATLTLKLSGFNYLQSNRSKPLILVEAGGTLNIETDGSSSGSLSLVTDASEAVTLETGAVLNIKGGVLYAGKTNGSSLTSVGSYAGSVNISGGSIHANLKGTLNISGGTIPTACTYYYGHGTTPTVTILGGSVGLKYQSNGSSPTGMEKVTFVNASGTKVYRTAVRLQDVQHLKNYVRAEWKDILYQTSANGGIIIARTAMSAVATLRVDAPQQPNVRKIETQSGNGTIVLPNRSVRSGEVVCITVQPDAGYTVTDVTVTEKNGTRVEVEALGGGQYQFVMPACEVTITADYGRATGFSDVPATAYYHDAVQWAVAQGIASGVGGGRFAPDAGCTRAQLVTMLWRAAGCPMVDDPVRLTDVDAQTYYAAAVRWAVAAGIVQGHGGGVFAPEDAVTREQVATILYRFAVSRGMMRDSTQALVSGFADADAVSDYAVSAFNWAIDADIVRGADGWLLPRRACTRAQIVTMLWRLLSA